MTNKKLPKATAIGQWQSPISAKSLSLANIRLGEPSLHDGCAYWLEGRPNEKGRTVLVKRDNDGVITDLTPPPYNVRSSVHEYGGGAYTIDANQVLFVNHADQGIYRINGNRIRQVYQRNGLRFADMVLDQPRGCVIAVAEDHRGEGEPNNFLCKINIASKTLVTLHEGADFYSSPTLNKQGSRLAWLTWMHPFMPWENTQLNTATLAKSDTPSSQSEVVLTNHQTLGDNESIFQPIFGPDDRLYFASDRNNWWNLYALNFDKETSDSTQETNTPQVDAITNQEAEFALPQWVFNMRTFGFVDDQTIIASRVINGVWDVCQTNVKTGETRALVEASESAWPYPAVEHLATSTDGFICLASGATQAQSIVLCKVDDNGTIDQQILQSASDSTVDEAYDSTVDEAYISSAETIEYATSDNERAHGFYYPPTNPNHTHFDNQAPPLLVLVHGGPTAATNGGFNPRIQFWTSRGFAVLDVNYRGSTGYGREYRRQLNLQWGLKDVQDCVHGAQHLIDNGKADAQRVYIMGGSAGGYTVLGALAFTQFFKGGISMYGIGDLEVLLGDTHKFESRYTYSLVGEYDEPLYRARSPLYSAKKITAPILFFQGTEDKVVPPNQAELMVAALKANDIPTQYVKMEGEGHGFRRSDSIETMLNTSLEFLTNLATHA